MDELCREIAVYEQKLEKLAPGDPARAPLLHNLAARLRRRFMVAGDPEDLDAAIDRSGGAVAEADGGARELSIYLTTLGNSLGDRYEHGRDPVDLGRAIRAQERAVLTCAAEDRAEFSANLASSLWDRFLRDGSAVDLDHAIERYEASLEIAPEGAQPGLYCNLSGALLDRYARSGSLDDLARAVDAGRRAVGVAAADVHAPAGYNALGGALASRYARTGNSADLDEAVDMLNQGLASCPPRSPWRARLLNNLGVALAARGTAADLERSVDAHAIAARTAAGGAGEALALNDLGAALLDRYQQTRRRRDLRRALRVLRRAVDRTPVEEPRRARRLANLARGLTLASGPAGHGRDAARARDTYRESMLALDTDPESVLAAAREWGRWAAETGRPADAAEAYEYGLDALDRLVGIQPRRRAKEVWVRAAVGVALAAAVEHAGLGHADRAALALERGRALVVTQELERDRADLARLPDAALAARYRRAADRLSVRLFSADRSEP
jgi:tetratricopeptide (TPR) repeat protein